LLITYSEDIGVLGLRNLINCIITACPNIKKLKLDMEYYNNSYHIINLNPGEFKLKHLQSLKLINFNLSLIEDKLANFVEGFVGPKTSSNCVKLKHLTLKIKN
jgi:hypothetical protein